MRLTVWIFGTLIFALSIASHPKENLTFPNGASQEYRLLVAPVIQDNITLAALEIAFGNVNKGLARAALAAGPETIKLAFTIKGIDRKRGEQLIKWGIEAVRLWNEVAPGAPFQVVDAAQKPSVTVTFEDQVSARGKLIAGHISWERSVKIRRDVAVTTVRADIRIANRTPAGRLLSEAQIIKTVCHELGHLLGLKDQSSTSSVMGPIGSNSAVPGEAERIALEELRYRTNAILESAFRQQSSTYVPREFVFAEAR